MSSITFSRVAIAAAAVLGASTSLAQGQYFGDPCNTCTPVQPVLQSCYQTVPVTEYRPVTQTVRRPVYRTEYVEQPVTVYRPVTEMKTTQVPTVQYRTVTQYRTVQRDMGRWVTQYRPNPKMSPCQYDQRPGVIGWVNRTGYQLRSAFTPKYTAIRQYQPRMMACSVPQTRQVAVRGTRSVSYNVTRMVATQTVQKRPVQRLTYVDQQVTVMRPQTAYRTVPIGTSVAYAPSGMGSSSVAYAPYAGSSLAYNGLSGSTIRNAEVIDDRAVQSAALTPEPDNGLPRRSADSRNDDIRSSARRNAAPAAGFKSPKTPTEDWGATAPAADAAPYTGRSRESQLNTPANRSSLIQSAPAAGSTARPYEGRRRTPATQTPATQAAEPDPFGDFNSFDVDPPSAGVSPPRSRFLRTSLTSSSTESNGWRPSRRVQSHVVPKITAPRISVAGR